MLKQLTRANDYELLRDVMVDILVGRVAIKNNANFYQYLVQTLAGELEQRGQPVTTDSMASSSAGPVLLHPNDEPLVRDIFWDLIRQGYVTVGDHDPNERFRLSHFGEQALKTQSPYRFHSTASYINLVEARVKDIDAITLAYLAEAADTFYADCLLSSSVMLGVAAEVEFKRLLDMAAAGSYAALFASAQKERNLLSKIQRFQVSVKGLEKDLAKKGIEDIETRFLAIQSVLRISRNDAGHANRAKIERAMAHNNLILFVPFAEMLSQLRLELG